MCGTLQIKAERSVAKKYFEMEANTEQKEILALMAEEQILNEFQDTWQNKLGKCAKGTPAFAMVQGNIDMYDLKLDVVAMEKRLYVPMFLKKAKPRNDYSGANLSVLDKQIQDTFRLKPNSEQMKLDYYPETKPIKWIYIQQFAKVCMCWRGYVRARVRACVAV